MFPCTVVAGITLSHRWVWRNNKLICKNCGQRRR